MRGAIYMDLLAISVSLVALILGAAIGWLIARSRFIRTIAELNSKLVLERRVNKQLSETVQVQVDAAGEKVCNRGHRHAGRTGARGSLIVGAGLQIRTCQILSG